jgi:hypothetical protein
MHYTLSLRTLDIKSELEMLSTPFVRLGTRRKIAITSPARPGTFAVRGYLIAWAKEGLAFGVGPDEVGGAIEVGCFRGRGEDVGEEEIAYCTLEQVSFLCHCCRATVYRQTYC